ncbi:MAG TPA: hypothetical protein VGP89_03445 [Candidatus Angelobacter sp.]|jgi:hypothetical protein|nr:hypothetical protein [Candidatus Angelobacter sp.]
MERFNVERQAEDFRAGQICTVVASCLAPRKGRPHHPSDFFSSLPEVDDQPQTPQEMLAQIKMITAMQNARTATE